MSKLGRGTVLRADRRHPLTAPSEGKEAVDRKEIALRPDQEDFVRRLYAVNANTIVVLISNFPFAMPWAAEHATTIVQMTHASQEQGNALADVLFGDFNPGGKLSQTWPKSLAQLPPIMDYDIRHGRTYMYFKGEPQYPFGYGLSYTTFALSHLTTSQPVVSGKGEVRVRVDVRNTGPRTGDEVVQLYVRHLGSQVEWPAKALKGFRRVTVAAGETRTVEIALRGADLAYWNATRHAWTVERGRVELMVGNSSADRDLTLRKTVEVAP